MKAGTNYIYILFAVVYFIYTIVKAGKKATQQKQAAPKLESTSTVRPPTASPGPQQHPGDDLKKMLEELLGGVPEARPAEKKIHKAEPVIMWPEPAKIIPQAKKEKTAPSHFATKAKEETSSFLAGEKQIPKKVFALVAEERQDTDSYSDDFDIRNAVIYSEILKRPEW